MSVETHFAIDPVFNCDSPINQHWSVTTEFQPCDNFTAVPASCACGLKNTTLKLRWCCSMIS